ncbi:MAG: 23S rRNA (guanosine(2251)-2'-O)-methyltransferase RlmB [Gammaproteobacteria bacterium]|jgi:23S rRNA (guanosine2251-2'-O)-methyltransferase|nr:23S rRNA (guanosine(2251)-2'-O)-methyltransferase RlmB [Gammaproteobacteria bacterium]MBT3488314.1 23S rRNA (guanosine(2251)-2'-O)-methyltransferase RlmB [Gammaproteobacteria bacterium]MBT3718414.1 23S rRNA (guanosine(2251)-2'-O)-methyltransferase RlmB [Gammaproteobacteria bacterium]MBT3844853.1 23S rRNA (guanosine(2251)-2'-O)-methyltransferase RlmB [Gammaproteobacteria bacterium]MBT3894357.1 23S rRNA (guanosine(2251)-2'-O)-methyltransferase RlmB [Gammaproteobacteria bacterium]
MKIDQQRVIFGIHAVDGWLNSGHSKTGDLLLLDRQRSDKRTQSLVEKAKKKGVEIRKQSRKELENYAPGAVHQGVVLYKAEISGTQGNETYDEGWLYEQVEVKGHSLLLLVLDGITDPHNLGACLRSADAAGVDAVVVPKDRAAAMGPVVRKVAAGAAESVPFVMVTNLSRMLKQLADMGVWVVGAADEATELLYQADLTASIAVVMGAEGGGMRRLTKERCSQLIKIPMAGSVSSLNVSVATGVVLFEVVRQRASC